MATLLNVYRATKNRSTNVNALKITRNDDYIAQNSTLNTCSIIIVPPRIQTEIIAEKNRKRRIYPEQQENFPTKFNDKLKHCLILFRIQVYFAVYHHCCLQSYIFSISF